MQMFNEMFHFTVANHVRPVNPSAQGEMIKISLIYENSGVWDEYAWDRCLN